MPTGDVARQTPRALLAPFQGAIRVSWALSGGFTTGQFLACLWLRIEGDAEWHAMGFSRDSSTPQIHLPNSIKRRALNIEPQGAKRSLFKHLVRLVPAADEVGEEVEEFVLIQ